MTVSEFRMRGDAAEAGSRIDAAIDAARQRLLSLQCTDGHWCGELEGDTILESEYLLLLHYLGRPRDQRFRKGVEYLRRQQIADGGWPIYAAGPTELNASVKAYFVLKMAGDSPDAPHMARARDAILALGGLDECNSFTKIYLSIFGQYEWSKCPAVPPEVILLPGWFAFNIYKMSYWSRCIIVPLSMIWAHKITSPVPEEWSIRELRAPRRVPAKVNRSRRERIWRSFFNALDALLKVIEAVPVKPFRKRALDKCAQWIVDHLDKSGGLGAIFPPMINTIFAFRAMGHPVDHPVIRSQLRALETLHIEDEETLRLQPCFSAVWDTALAVHILRESGSADDDPHLLDGVRWLMQKQVKTIGDWKVNNPNGEGAGWFFQYENEFYPDTDDTSEVLLAVNSVRFPEPLEERARCESIDSAVSWQLSMQNRDGGWGAFDKECTNEVFTFIPFADHNAMIDPSCEDITGRTLEALMILGFDEKHPAVRGGIRFLHAKQDFSGTWYGRWGCNYIYGSFLAMRGLKMAGDATRLDRAAKWFIERQNEDGGWGELQHSYDDPMLKGVGPSTPSQTAWALLALIAAGQPDCDAAQRGVDYLLKNQRGDGAWRDDTWTATGFPKVFYLRYHLYATYFPIWALSEYRRTVLS